ncbi:L-carnitine dehydratase/bile acid-inducible protein F [Kwoniella heveanensis CBS 569]|nr:L-carnitine dehydratase/bile acid-inducible protein F [Kwoniella heveanensis CBS 569]
MSVLKCRTTLRNAAGLPQRKSVYSSTYISRTGLRAYSIPPKSDASVDERPLAGIKVVDLTRVLAGPLATMMLSDLGADVIKIESPKHGDDTRSWLPPSAPLPSTTEDYPRPDLPPESAYFLQANRNKRSLTLNLKSNKGREVIHRLIEQADVLVENYVPGKLEKFGLGYGTVRKLNPRLVYCSITGYGSSGPYAQAPGYDVVIEAEAGLMHITGEKGGKPVKVGVAVTDVLTGHYAQSGILAALLKRAITGKGSRVECSLFESQIASLVNIGSNYLIAGQEASRWGTSHPSIVPYQVFPTGDSYIMLSAGNDTQWAILCSPAVFDKQEWVDDVRFARNSGRVENREVLVRLIEGVLGEKSTAEWCERLKGKGIPFAPINNIAQTFAHPQAIARQVVEEVEHPRAGRIKLASAPVSYDGSKPKASIPTKSSKNSDTGST